MKLGRRRERKHVIGETGEVEIHIFWENWRMNTYQRGDLEDGYMSLGWGKDIIVEQIDIAILT